ncbi:MAG: ribokinase [Eubacteriales bacterium]|nr:ribokinase [Eubacteriales bacterium]
MKVLNLGSLNIDYTYSLDHIMQAKETQAALDRKVFAGGKGLNQSIAMTRAGLEVCHAGCIGADGTLLLETLRNEGVDTSLIRQLEDRPSGHAMIQVDKMGQNAVMTYGGANFDITQEYIDEVLEQFGEGDALVLQNEISNLDYAIERAYEKKMMIILNPSPFDNMLRQYDLTKVSMFFVNEVEGKQLTTFVQPGDILIGMRQYYPDTKCVLTLGAQGAFYQDKTSSAYQPATKVRAVDATAAGDIFEGYFIAAYLQGKKPAEALKIATYAAGIAVTRKGAALSAPTMEETLAAIAK